MDGLRLQFFNDWANAGVTEQGVRKYWREHAWQGGDGEERVQGLRGSAGILLSLRLLELGLQEVRPELCP